MPAKRGKTRTIEVGYLARVEGEGALYVKVRNNEVVDVQLKIFEPPRFFESLLRGLLYHRYRLADDGTIADAKIVPPTSQNQKTIEADLRAFVASHLEMPKKELEWSCEQVVRNHDPCISCATHFVRLDLDRSDA